jgi:hypothetical protein
MSNLLTESVWACRVVLDNADYHERLSGLFLIRFSRAQFGPLCFSEVPCGAVLFR